VCSAMIWNTRFSPRCPSLWHKYHKDCPKSIAPKSCRYSTGLESPDFVLQSVAAAPVSRRMVRFARLVGESQLTDAAAAGQTERRLWVQAA